MLWKHNIRYACPIHHSEYCIKMTKGLLFQAQVKVNHQVNSGNPQSYVVSRQKQKS